MIPNFILRLTQDVNDKPLVVVLAWLQSKQKHLSKYAQLYLDQGFDVLVTQITPWQLLWPVKGSQVGFSIIGFDLQNPSETQKSYIKNRYAFVSLSVEPLTH